jgi:ABC-type oligopeptide transport system substrate-binding subunit
MSVQKLRAALNAVFDKTLTVQQVQRVANAYYQRPADQTADDAAAIVHAKIRKRLLAVVRQSEADIAAQSAREAAESGVDVDFNPEETQP